MARASYVFDPEEKRMVPKALYVRRVMAPRMEKRSDLPSPRVITDGMDAIKSMADGRVYESKSAYYASVRRAGCEIVGHDPNWTDYVGQKYDEKQHEADIVADVKKAIEIEASK